MKSCRAAHVGVRPRLATISPTAPKRLSVPMMKTRKNERVKEEMKTIRENLAFESEKGLVSSSFRSPFQTKDGTATLNVECFGSNGDSDDSTWPVLLFIHGVCESAETYSVQHLAVAARKNQWRLYVLELEGHGLSSGKRAVCGNFARLCGHVQEFIQHAIALASNNSNDNEVPPPSFAICGTSLGGVLSAYAADYAAKNETKNRFEKFVGAALIAPAVGVAPEALPSAPVVSALRCLALIAPSAGFLTPVEDPTHYACPSTSKRNFSGNWPLSTSKMLLDVTSHQVQKDQKTSKLLLDNTQLLIMAGTKDDIVPIHTIQDFFNRAKTEDKSLVEIPKADHGLMFQEDTANVVTERLFQWLNYRIQ